MNFSVVILFCIVTTAFVLFVGGWLRVDLIGLLVLSALALTGLVSGQEALAGFSSPAVVTVWAMFILSAGLSRTGIAHRLGQPLQRFAKGSEALLVAVLMITASILSALINTVTVASILLQATMELARRSGRSPSRILMPLALGCLLGGPFTAISTPPNILVTDALRSAGLQPFGLFAFTPITAAIVAGGILFVVFVGLRLLPKRNATRHGHQTAPGASYELETHLFSTRIPKGSLLSDRTLAESRLGSALDLTVLGLQRRGRVILAPRPTEILQEEDVLIVHGPRENEKFLHGYEHLRLEPTTIIEGLACPALSRAEGVIHENSPLVGAKLIKSGLRGEHKVHVLEVVNPQGISISDLRSHRLGSGDRLILWGEPQALEVLSRGELVADLRLLPVKDAPEKAFDRERFLAVRVPAGSVLVGRDLVESRLGNVFGLTVVGILRNGEYACMPSPA